MKSPDPVTELTRCYVTQRNRHIDAEHREMLRIVLERLAKAEAAVDELIDLRDMALSSEWEHAVSGWRGGKESK